MTTTHPTFETLYRTFEPYIRAIISRRVHRDAVDDIAQTTWMQIHQHLLADAEFTNLRAWIASVARTECTRYRRQNPETISLDAPIAVDDTGDELTLLDVIGDVHADVSPVLRELLVAAVEELPPSTRRVMELHYYGSRPIADISLELRLAVGSVKWHLSEGRRLLRDRLIATEPAEKSA